MKALPPLILALVIIGLVIGSVIHWAFAFLALPLLGAFGWLAVGQEALQRQKKIQQMKRFRRAAKARKVEFDDDDRKTIAV
jgi:predicted MFS family arabinose efflux permease